MNIFSKTLVLAGSLLAVSAVTRAQSKLTLKNGQKFEMVTETKVGMTQEMNGQVQETKSENTTTRNLEVKEARPSGYLISTTLSKLKMTGSNPGGETKYDSENPADKDSEAGKELGKNVGKTTEVTTDGAGKVTDVKRDNDEGEKGGMAALSQMISGTSKDGGVAHLLLQFPSATPKAGDSWTDSSKNELSKTQYTYTVKAVNGGDITLDLKEETNLSTDFEQGGMSITVTTSSITKGEAVYELASGLLKQKTTTTEGTGNADVSGMMQIPITMNRSTTITVKKL